MRILVVTPALPFPFDKDGFMLALGTLVNEWVSKSYEVHISCFGRIDPKAYEFFTEAGVVVYCNDITSSFPGVVHFSKFGTFIRPRNSFGYDFGKYNLVTGDCFDFVVLSRFESVFLLDKIKKSIDVKTTVFFEIDALSLLYERMSKNSTSLIERYYNLIQSKLINRVEKKYYSEFDKTAFVSSSDKRYVLEKHPQLDSSKIFNIRNGVSISEKVNRREALSDVIKLGFSGDFSYKPNQLAALFIINKIIPCLLTSKTSFEVKLIGRNPTPEMISASNRYSSILTVTGQVENVTSELSYLDIYICPLFVGTGIKNKILNVMGIGLPFIASSVAVEGIDELEGGDYFKSVDSMDGDVWLEHIHSILECYDEFKQQSDRYQQIISDNYRWANIAEEFIVKSISKEVV